ncbi:MAG: diadenylate cyclase CdaA [Pseudomonadota bacterium]
MIEFLSQISTASLREIVVSAVDVAIVYYAIYRVLLLIRGTRAVQMLVGLLLVIMTYFASRYFQLATLNWLLDNFLQSFVVLLIIVFQSDIRRALVHFGRRPLLDRLSRQEKAFSIEEVTRAASRMGQNRIGGIIVLERAADLGDYIQEGVLIDARISRELLLAIFHTRSPIHDGAVILQQGRVAAAGVFLPLTANPNVSKALGTRHRAAIGVSEEVDAVVVVVSEESGKISLVVEGQITRDLDPPTLRKVLTSLFTSQLSKAARRLSGAGA